VIWTPSRKMDTLPVHLFRLTSVEVRWYWTPGHLKIFNLRKILKIYYI
jgi:hypothetical protein